MSSKHVPSLNGLRAISIVFVIIGHIGYRSFNWADSPGGQLGVNVFFIVSGFLITMLMLDEENLNGKVNLKKFYARRAFRIFPPLYFLLPNVWSFATSRNSTFPYQFMDYFAYIH
jgi:peptidoglycan/LPS O-acetylase OafA/YrhL